MDFELTKEEEAAISALKKLAKKWPKSLWLYSASGSLNVMRKTEDGKFAFRGGRFGEGFDSEYVIETITGIDNDGGDW